MTLGRQVLEPTVESVNAPATAPAPPREITPKDESTTPARPVLAAQTGTIEGLIQSVFGSDGTMALAIAKAESGLQPTVINRTGCCVGIFQIHRYAHASQIPGTTMAEKTAWLQVPENNIRLAKQLKDSSGWYPWETYTNGAYKQFLR